ncbi:sugar-binding protein [Streptococcus sp. HMSC061D01]|uniref:sugar-binding protein n=1 Tax=Streptococcus sp. HMSC061D01 TaxID=1739263 RepID=UPI0008A2772D|nr:sugar-binding protein [Streptococcus sp. HMSC061D01]OFL61585.1 sugar-binding protein [Streptococcus sp. HMSC061D01]
MAFENLNTAESRKRHLGIIEDVLAVNSYSAPLVLSNEAVEMNGRSFTVAKGNTTPLKDYRRNKDNQFDHVETEERVYTLNEEKYWGRFVDKLDERDSNGQVNIDYVIARQAAEVVAPYLDELRFGAALGNVSDNVIMGKTKGENNAYNAVLDVSEKLDELGIIKDRLLFVTPSFYKKVKSEIVRLPQGDADKKVLAKGYVGELDDFTVYKVPSKFLPNVDALASAPGVVTSPLQVDDTKYNDNIPGRFGELVEQLLYTGAYVLEHFQKYIITIADNKPAAKKSAQGEVIIRAKEWKTGTDYLAGDQVQSDGKVYEAIKDISASATKPESDTTNWKEKK